MKSRSLKMDRILSTHDMVSYLQSRGFVPIPDVRGRVKFCCPLHKDDTPSFLVYPAESDHPYQHFHCFGCKKRGNVIHLMSELEGVSFKDMLARLGDGLGIDVTDEIEYVIQRITRRVEEDRKEDEEMEANYLLTSRAMNQHLVATSFDPVEISGCEKMLQRLDDAFAASNSTAVSELAGAIPEVLGKRLRARAEEAERELRESMIVYARMTQSAALKG